MNVLFQLLDDVLFNDFVVDTMVSAKIRGRISRTMSFKLAKQVVEANRIRLRTR